MKPIVTTLTSALVGAALVVIGVLVVAVPAILLWMVSFELVGDPLTFAGGIGGVWLLGHGVPLEFDFSAEAALGFGASPEAVTLPLSLPLVGLTLITMAGGIQAGWRALSQGRMAVPMLMASAIGFGVLTALVFGFAQPIVSSSVWYAIARPLFWYVVALTIGGVARSIRDGQLWQKSVVTPLAKLGRESIAEWIASALRLAGVATAGVLLIASTGVAITLGVHFTEIIGVSQSLNLDAIGVFVIAVGQFLLIPVAIIWAISWFSGAGFAIGAGSSIDSFEQLLGPLPAFPLLGGLPASWGGAGLFAPLLIVLVGLMAGAWVGSRRPWRESPWWQSVAAVVGAGVVVGVVIEIVAGFARGSIGPGRLSVTGPEPYMTGAFVAAEITFGLLIGVLARRLDQYWVSPLTETVKSRRMSARATREQEWANLGKPETFEHDLRRRGVYEPESLGEVERSHKLDAGVDVDGEREYERDLVSEFDTVEYELEDNVETGAVITDAFSFQRDRMSSEYFSHGGDNAHEPDEGLGDGEWHDNDDNFEEPEFEGSTGDVSNEADTAEIPDLPENTGAWFEQFADANEHGRGGEFTQDADNESDSTDEATTSPEPHSRTDAEADTAQNTGVSAPELTDVEAIEKAFAWDASAASDLDAEQSQPEQSRQPHSKRKLRGLFRRKSD